MSRFYRATVKITTAQTTLALFWIQLPVLPPNKKYVLRQVINGFLTVATAGNTVVQIQNKKATAMATTISRDLIYSKPIFNSGNIPIDTFEGDQHELNSRDITVTTYASAACGVLCCDMLFEKVPCDLIQDTRRKVLAK